MAALEELITLIKTVVVPQLEKMGDHVEKLASKTESISLSHERQNGQIKRLEDKVGNFPCDANTKILQGFGARIADLESCMKAGHKQNAECREKNAKVDKALTLAQANKKKNEEQEARHALMLQEEKERHRRLSGQLWLLIIAVTGAGATAFFQLILNKIIP